MFPRKRFQNIKETSSYYRKTTIYVPKKKVYYEVFILTNWKRNQQCDR